MKSMQRGTSTLLQSQRASSVRLRGSDLSVDQSSIKGDSLSEGSVHNEDDGMVREVYRKLDSKEKPLSQRWYRERQSHLSANQRKTIRELWPIYGIDLKYGSKLNPHETFSSNVLFTSQSPVSLDIGFGSGDSLIHYATNNPEHICIGMEIHKASISTALKSIHASNLRNIKLIRGDVALLLNQYLADDCLNYVSVYFPDPWPNEFRDGERRVIRTGIISLLSKKLRNMGKLRIATDVEDYAKHVVTVMNQSNGAALSDNLLSKTNGSSKWTQTFYRQHEPGQDIPHWRPFTKYEQIAKFDGREVHDFEYEITKTI